MELTGGCQCGALRYRVTGEPLRSALCHCTDCRKSAGAPMVGWAAFAEEDFVIEQGEATTHNSSGASLRSFCPSCGTGVYFRNAEMLPGIVDIQTATLDDPDAVPPTVQIQVAERIGWMETAHALPAFSRWPDPE
jgi:hypothetical protein